jgi:hypothetical protein
MYNSSTIKHYSNEYLEEPKSKDDNSDFESTSSDIVMGSIPKMIWMKISLTSLGMLTVRAAVEGMLLMES